MLRKTQDCGTGYMPIKNVDISKQQEINLTLIEMEKLDFMQMNAKLISYNGWTIAKALEAEVLYKKWLALHKVYGELLEIAPNDLVDEYWHAHILDTQKYMKDCEVILGRYLHHYPYFGLTEDESQKELDEGFKLTQELFKAHFGHDIIGNNNKCKATSCR